MKLDALTSQAVTHTAHCLLGCSIGEVSGMIIAQALHWQNVAQTILAIVLAFFFGYLLTYRSAKSRGADKKAAAQTALATDTISITSMEIVDNAVVWLIPGAIYATLGDFMFWWTLALSLAIAFMITVPVNRFMISKNPHAHHH
jgi:uncharacterized membrane protein YbjE (DUF340 family)